MSGALQQLLAAPSLVDATLIIAIGVLCCEDVEDIEKVGIGALDLARLRRSRNRNTRLQHWSHCSESRNLTFTHAKHLGKLSA